MGNSCTICFDEITKPSITLPCNHQFCLNCFKTWTTNLCPTCREPIKPGTIGLATTIKLTGIDEEDEDSYEEKPRRGLKRKHSFNSVTKM